MTDPAITAAIAIPALGSNPHPTKGTPPMNLNDITLTAKIPLDANLDNRTTIGPSVHLSPTGTSWYPHPLIYVGDQVMSVEQAEVAARHLLAAVAMAREVTR